jgi:hypothetical protein
MTIRTLALRAAEGDPNSPRVATGAVIQIPPATGSAITIDVRIVPHLHHRAAIRDRHALLRTHPRALRAGSLLLPDDERPCNSSREMRRILSQAVEIGPSTPVLCQH